MDFEVIIIGGSYAGLSAALALGRSNRRVLVIDSGQPCNRQTPHSHNFLTHDGDKPAEIAKQAKAEVLKYPTVQFLNEPAVSAHKIQNGFEIETENSGIFSGRKILLSTGLKDIMPDIAGFAECWGKSIIHCPYCHGYEVKDKKTGLLMNGDMAFEMAKLIYHWNKDLTILTNGEARLSNEQRDLLKSRSIEIIEKKTEAFIHSEGHLKQLNFKDGSSIELTAVYAKPAIVQHSILHQMLGCALDENGIIKVDSFQKTGTAGVYAAGDCSTLMRSLSVTTAAGTVAGAMINRELIEEDF